MTSNINHKDTVEFFETNNYFGAHPDSIVFFEQSTLPAMDLEGKIIMKSPYEVQLSPNGNGALFEAINYNALIKNHIKKVKFVQVIGVDNVLNKILDPTHIGYTEQHNFDASLKCCVKSSPEEKVGVVLKKNGKYDIVEYSEISSEMAAQ